MTTVTTDVALNKLEIVPGVVGVIDSWEIQTRK